MPSSATATEETTTSPTTPEHEQQPNQSRRDSDRWIRRLATYCLRSKWLVVAAFGGGVVGMGAAAFVPLVTRQIVDQVIIGQRQPMLPWVGALLGLGLVTFGAGFRSEERR